MTLRHFKLALAFAFIMATGFTTSTAAVVYQYGFENLCGNGCSTASPWTGTPDVLAANLSSSSWATSYSAGFVSYDGSCGTSACQALSLSHNNYPASTTYTLTFTVNAGYALNVTGLSFWNRISNDGPNKASITINGTTAVASQTLTASPGANTGTLTPANSINNLTGTVTLVITLTGATSASGTFRLDDFVIDGSVTNASAIPVYNVTGGGRFCLGDTGVDIGLAGSDTGVTYQLKNSNYSNVGNPVSGTGSAISFGLQTVAGTYTVVGTNTTTADTGTMTGSATIVINQPPVVNLGTAITQCGGSATLDAGNAGSAFVWSDNSTQQTDIVSITGTYSVIVTDTNTCSASASVSVTINTPPSISLSASNLTVCVGQSTTIAATGATSYLWSNGLTTSSITVQPTVPTTYNVTGTDNNCTATSAAGINVLPALTDTVTTQLCQGQSYNGHSATGTYSDTLVAAGGCDSIVTLYLQILPAVTGATTSQTICAGQSYQGHTTGGTFTDTLTSVSGCDSVVSLQLTVTPAITSSAIQTICYGKSYNGHTASGNYSDTLQSASSCDSIVSLTLTVLSKITYTYAYAICKYDTFMGHTATGNYYDTLIAANGCDSIVELQLTVNSLPHTTLYLTFDTICSNAAVITMSGGSPAGGYYSGQGIVDSQFVPSAAPLGYDSIVYTYTDSNGCTKDRYEFAYTITCTDSVDTTGTDTTKTPTAIRDISNVTFHVLPNPTQDYLTIQSNSSNTPYSLNLYDLLGRLVLSQPETNNNSGKTIVDLRQLPAGLYVLNIIEASGKASSFKIVRD